MNNLLYMLKATLLQNKMILFLAVIISYLAGVVVLLLIPKASALSISTTLNIRTDYMTLHTNLIFGFFLSVALLFLKKGFSSIAEIFAMAFWACFTISILIVSDSIFSSPLVFDFLPVLTLTAILAIFKSTAVFFNIVLFVNGIYYLAFLRSHHKVAQINSR